MVDTLSGVAMGKLPDYETTYPTVAVACIHTYYVVCTEYVPTTTSVSILLAI